ncbi:MAG: hypothetical protein ACLQQ0_12890 [Limisphaerales bacterium]
MYYYAAIERFNPDNGERWVGFTRWLGRTDLTRIITLDSALCPPVVHPESADDWQYVAKEEFMLDFFTDLNFVLRRVTSHRPSTVVAVARDPSADDINNFPHPDFELAGFDVVDAQFTASALLNNRFPDVVNVSKLASESGLIKSREWAGKIRDTLHRRHPDRADARCHVWAVWRYIGIAGPGA